MHSPEWVSDTSLFFFESEEQPNVKEVNDTHVALGEFTRVGAPVRDISVANS